MKTHLETLHRTAAIICRQQQPCLLLSVYAHVRLPNSKALLQRHCFHDTQTASCKLRPWQPGLVCVTAAWQSYAHKSQCHVRKSRSQHRRPQVEHPYST